jgi:uncharacterized protein YvpB
MAKGFTILFGLLILALVLSGCGAGKVFAAQEPTLTPTATPTLTLTPTMVPTATLTVTLTSTATPTATLPAEAYVENIHGHHQALSLDCESSVAVDWAAHFGITINEFDFQHSLPISDNPDLGFVGYSTGPWGQIPPYAYGVHAAPVAAVLNNKYGLTAYGVKNFTLDQLRHELAAGRPVIAWIVGDLESGTPVLYTDSKGNQTIVAPYEHVIMVTGYDANYIYYLNEQHAFRIETKYFMRSWKVLGYMVVYRGDQ